MTCNTKTLLTAALGAGLAVAGTSASAITIYQDDFSGNDRHPGVNINIGFADGHTQGIEVNEVNEVNDLDQLEWHRE